jgi:hypothetical protein
LIEMLRRYRFTWSLTIRYWKINIRVDVIDIMWHYEL